MTRWVAGQLEPDVPVHFTAFHPDFKMRDRPPTPPKTLTRAHRIALDNGIRYTYTGNVHDPAGQSTCCHECGALLIERDWCRLGAWRLTGDGRCVSCGTPLAGVFDGPPGTWGPKRMPVRRLRSIECECRSQDSYQPLQRVQSTSEWSRCTVRHTLRAGFSVPRPGLAARPEGLRER